MANAEPNNLVVLKTCSTEFDEIMIKFTTQNSRQLEKQTDKGLDALKKVVHKEGEYLRNKIADAITKLNDDNTEKHEPVEEIIIPAEKREGIINKLRKVL